MNHANIKTQVDNILGTGDLFFTTVVPKATHRSVDMLSKTLGTFVIKI